MLSLNTSSYVSLALKVTLGDPQLVKRLLTLASNGSSAYSFCFFGEILTVLALPGSGEIFASNLVDFGPKIGYLNDVTAVYALDSVGLNFLSVSDMSC